MTENNTQTTSMQALLEMVVTRGGSDLHILVGSPPHVRIANQLYPVENLPPLTVEAAEQLILPLMNPEQQEYFRTNRELDFSYQYSDRGRFRVNVYYEKGRIAAALRLIPLQIKTIDELGLPSVFHQLTQFSQGLVLITGPTGEGKSTTLAAMIDEINHTRSEHIITVEDPVEFVYRPDKSIISQREVGKDTHSWEIALRSALREDPDVVLVGEMRDLETIAAAITIAETGHLVLATLHTATAAQTIDRIIDVFPSHQQDQVRMQLAATLRYVASQRLVSKKDGSLTAVFELLSANSAVQNLIRESKTYQIDNVIQTSANEGMMLIEANLAQLVRQGVITKEQALKKAFRPHELSRLLGEG